MPLSAKKLKHQNKKPDLNPVKSAVVKVKKDKESDIQQVVNHYFYTKGLSLEQIKQDAKKRKIIYGRFAKPAKQLIDLSGSVAKAKKAIDKIAKWAQSRNLDYSIETIFKKWLEMDRLKPKERVHKPFYGGNPVIWSEAKRKWYVVSDEGQWLEFAGDEKDFEWREK